jgi:hypothetical protein
MSAAPAIADEAMQRDNAAQNARRNRIETPPDCFNVIAT